MTITYELNKNLPPLAWLATCNSGKCHVICGEKVECREDFFVDGVWSGEFENGDFADSEWFCGTGGKLNEYKIIFSTPSHTIGALYLTKAEGGGTV